MRALDPDTLDGVGREEKQGDGTSISLSSRVPQILGVSNSLKAGNILETLTWRCRQVTGFKRPEFGGEIPEGDRNLKVTGKKIDYKPPRPIESLGKGHSQGTVSL